MSSKADAARYRKNFQDELDGAALYARLAAAEPDPVRKDLFLQMSQAEAGHAEVWRQHLLAIGVDPGTHSPGWRTRLLGAAARRFGVHFVLPVVAAAEVADRDKYAGQADAAALSSDERGHAAVIQAAAGHDRPAGSIGADIGRAEPWHRGASGNDLRAAVLGANDGLVSNFCLLMGVAGAGAEGRTILLTGFAGVVAGACSMALGEWLSVTNARELARTQIGREREEIEQTPEAEQKELALIYQAKGLAKADAQRTAADVMKNPAIALDTLAREELGIDPGDLGGSAWRAAATSFALFTVGALVSVVPFTFAQGTPAILLSAAFSAAALAAIGMLTSLFNGRSSLFSAARQVVIGSIAAAVTYGTGLVLGVSLS